MTNLFKQAQATIVSLLFFTLLLGGLYPVLTLAIVQTAFHARAEGSLIHDTKGQVIGSRLIGQTFSQPQYLWGRLSATGPAPYNAGASSGSNLGVNNPALMDAVKGRIDALNSARPVPVDLVTASASGLDPEISPAAAAYQVPRIATARHVAEATVTEAIARSTKGRTFGILGEPRVNVLEVNLRLDGQLK
ncbi:MAG: potassium-transporting ATPase subunit KdpC [Asticcacaulis sp.]|uniref:potassium-transporting ATPase subunit KdpC n=1 Tax=Asticcacaulis sp. TaxID=1872648 RepID=UPI0039E427BE